MKLLQIPAIAVVLTLGLFGCQAAKLPTIVAQVEATSLAAMRTVNLVTLSLAGEDGEKFNKLLEQKLTETLGIYISHGSRWSLTVLEVKYVTPHFKQEIQHYKLSVEAELVDLDGKQGWRAVVATPELIAGPEWPEGQVREHLVDSAVKALVEQLPLIRMEEEEEEEKAEEKKKEK